MDAHYDNLAGMLERAAGHPAVPGIGYLRDDGEAESQSYSTLLQTASGLLNHLRARGLKAGDYLILSATSNEDFIPIFWACVLGGIVPVPLAPPRAGHSLDRLLNAWTLLREPHMLLDDPIDGPIPIARQILTGSLQKETSRVTFHRARPDDTAFLQFSSGSTGQPKGVVITHRNILANTRAIARGLDITREDSGLNWMPLFHDFGLVGFHLTAVHCAIPQFHLPARSFIRCPLLWLDCLERHQATITASPNFGYSLVLGKLQNETWHWDLSRVRVILNGAEPISVPLMNRFIERLAPCGLPASAMFPVYGMAEATLAVSFPALGAAPAIARLDRHALQKDWHATEAASGDGGIDLCMEGSAVEGCEIRIVNEEGDAAADSSVGHIQIRGANVTPGYLENPEANLAAFCDSGDGGYRWFRTGDLGFLRGGELCVTGRAKGILFANGCNYYVHDMENVAQEVDGVSAGRVAVSACRRDGVDRDLVLLFIGSRTVEEAVSMFVAVRRKLQSVFGVPVDVMVPLKPGQFPKTTSGKLQRYRLSEDYAAGLFDSGIATLSELVARHEAASRVPPGTAMERFVHRIWCEQMRRAPESVGVHDSFEELGGTSLDLVAILRAIEHRMNLRLHSNQVAAHRTIAQFAAFLDRHAVALRAGRGPATYFQG